MGSSLECEFMVARGQRLTSLSYGVEREQGVVSLSVARGVGRMRSGALIMRKCMPSASLLQRTRLVHPVVFVALALRGLTGACSWLGKGQAASDEFKACYAAM